MSCHSWSFTGSSPSGYALWKCLYCAHFSLNQRNLPSAGQVSVPALWVWVKCVCVASDCVCVCVSKIKGLRGCLVFFFFFSARGGCCVGGGGGCVCVCVCAL